MTTQNTRDHETRFALLEQQQSDVVSQLSRFGRSVDHLAEVVADLKSRPQLDIKQIGAAIIVTGAVLTYMGTFVRTIIRADAEKLLGAQISIAKQTDANHAHLKEIEQKWRLYSFNTGQRDTKQEAEIEALKKWVDVIEPRLFNHHIESARELAKVGSDTGWLAEMKTTKH